MNIEHDSGQTHSVYTRETTRQPQPLDSIPPPSSRRAVPPMMGSMEQGPRIDTLPRVDLVLYRAKSARGEGSLANVSEGAVFVRADLTPDVGEEVHLVLDGPTPPISLQGRVGWIGRRHDGIGGFGAVLRDPPKEYVDLVRAIGLSRNLEGPQRVSPRIVLTIPVTIEFGTSRDRGTLSDLSLSGARLENMAVRPPVGSLVTLLYSPDGSAKPFGVVARVVRATDTGGYAVQFEALDPYLKTALQQAASALLGLPSSAPPE